MGVVKMPEMLSPELVRALTGNMYTVKGEPSPEDEMAAAWKEYLKPEKKCKRREDTVVQASECSGDIEAISPKKVKFIFVLNNAVVINVNTAAEGDGTLE